MAIVLQITGELGFVEIVVFVVLRTLQGQLESETLLGNLVDPNTRFNLNRS